MGTADRYFSDEKPRTIWNLIHQRLLDRLFMFSRQPRSNSSSEASSDRQSFACEEPLSTLGAGAGALLMPGLAPVGSTFAGAAGAMLIRVNSAILDLEGIEASATALSGSLASCSMISCAR